MRIKHARRRGHRGPGSSKTVGYNSFHCSGSGIISCPFFQSNPRLAPASRHSRSGQRLCQFRPVLPRGAATRSRCFFASKGVPISIRPSRRGTRWQQSTLLLATHKIPIRSVAPVMRWPKHSKSCSFPPVQSSANKGAVGIQHGIKSPPSF